MAIAEHRVGLSLITCSPIRTVIPEVHKRFYTEKVVLPAEQLSGQRRQAPYCRQSVQLVLMSGCPPTGFVFCCFNNNYKITPDSFDCWMRILKQVDGSVLWLLEDNATAANNLRNEAVARGVDAERWFLRSECHVGPLSEASSGRFVPGYSAVQRSHNRERRAVERFTGADLPSGKRLRAEWLRACCKRYICPN